MLSATTTPTTNINRFCNIWFSSKRFGVVGCEKTGDQTYRSAASFRLFAEGSASITARFSGQGDARIITRFTNESIKALTLGERIPIVGFALRAALELFTQSLQPGRSVENQ